MSEQTLTLPRAAAAGGSRRLAAGSLAWAVLLGNSAVIVWLWIHGGNLTLNSSGDVLTSIARITGLLAAYLALIQVTGFGGSTVSSARTRQTARSAASIAASSPSPTRTRV